IVTASDGSLSQSQSFTWTVLDANALDLSSPLTWAPVAGADAYRVTAGTTVGANDLADSGETTQLTYDASGLGDALDHPAVEWDVPPNPFEFLGYAIRLDDVRTDLGAQPPTACASATGPTCFRVSL